MNNKLSDNYLYKLEILFDIFSLLIQNRMKDPTILHPSIKFLIDFFFTPKTMKILGHYKYHTHNRLFSFAIYF